MQDALPVPRCLHQPLAISEDNRPYHVTHHAAASPHALRDESASEVTAGPAGEQPEQDDEAVVVVTQKDVRMLNTAIRGLATVWQSTLT
jgi:hypothetical protein